MLARPDRLFQQLRAQLRGGGVEEHRVVPRCERPVQVRAEPRDTVLRGERRDLLRIAPDQDRVGHEARAVPEHHAALPPDFQDRAREVLVRAHAPGHAVHDDADAPLGHGGRYFSFARPRLWMILRSRSNCSLAHLA